MKLFNNRKRAVKITREDFDHLVNTINACHGQASRAKHEAVVAQEAALECAKLTDEKFDGLNHNGVATAINKLNAEVLSDRKKADITHLQYLMGLEAYEPTLAGKVDAIVKHLGLEFNITEESKTPSEVVSKKKAPAKKKDKK